MPVPFTVRLIAEPHLDVTLTAWFDRNADGWPANVTDVRIEAMPACRVHAVEISDPDGDTLWVIPADVVVDVAAGETVLIPVGSIVARPDHRP